MIGPIGYSELIVLGIVAVVLFGRKLPEVARSVGNSYAQFRKGLADIQTTFRDDEFESTPARLGDERDDDELAEPTSPRFQPPMAEVDETVGN